MQRRLPLVIAAVAFVTYLITLNHSATFAGLLNLAKVVGWDWRPNLGAPLQVLVTLPVRFLPAGIQLAALNLIAAACAAAALGLLARCVSLLPHDRTRDQRQVERSEHSLLSSRWAWVPPVLAAGVCGLQLSFWENAVVGTGEALDLLVFAWLVHSLLMYRLDQRESRLGWFALVYGLGVANNHAMIGFFPLFLGAMIWIRGMSFFNVRFLLRTAALGICGLLLYLVLPTAAALGADTGYSWWDMLRTYWAAQKDNLIEFPRVIVLLLSLTSILPVVFMGIRWPAQFGEVSPLGNTLTNLMTHVIHLVFLVACTYVAFDQFFSPRNLAGREAAFLPLYFLGALSVGYCSGYFLLVCGSAAPGPAQWQRPSALRQLANKAIVALILVSLVAIPGLLAYLNLPQILANTGSALSRISELAAKSLPPEGAVVLSDEPFRIYAMENELRRLGGREKFVLIDTRSLEMGGYHIYMQKRHPDQWPKVSGKLAPSDRIPQPSLVQLMLSMSQKLPIVYLHPSFGYYFEHFEMRPKGLVYQLRPYSAATVSGAPLTGQEVAEGDRFWQQVKSEELSRIMRKIPPAEFPKPGAKLRRRPVSLEMYVGRSYAHALNLFGVAAQRAGDFAKASEYYDLALKLDPYSAAALINSQYNRQYREGRRDGLKPGDDVLKRINAAGGTWEGVLGLFGPVEEPEACYAVARAFDVGNNPRQAAQYMERVIHYAPDRVDAHVILAGLAVRASLPDVALQKIAELRSGPLSAKLTQAQLVELIVSEAWAHVVKSNLTLAAQLLRAEQARQPAEAAPWTALFDIYRSAGQMTNALAVVEEQLQVQPRNVQALVNAAVLRGYLGQTNVALALLNRALEVNARDEFALLNRAYLYSSMNRLDEAQKDFETLQGIKGASSTQVNLGLADVHFRKKNNREALRLYRQLLKAVPTGSPERRLVLDRIKQLD